MTDEFINFYNNFVENIKINDNKFTLSRGYEIDFINKNTIETVWKCVSVNNQIKPKIFIGFDKELYFSFEQQEKQIDENYTKNKIIEKIKDPSKFLAKLQFPNFIKKTYKVNNWNDLSNIIDINSLVEDKNSILFPFYRRYVKLHYNEERGYTLPKASITSRNIKKAILILSENNKTNEFEFEEIKREIFKMSANIHQIGFDLKPCKTLSGIAYESAYGNDILLPKYENNKMYIIKSIPT